VPETEETEEPTTTYVEVPATVQVPVKGSVSEDNTTLHELRSTKPEYEFRLQWWFDEARTRVTFNMTGKAAGYVSVGWGKASARVHEQTDMYVGWVSDADGSVTVLDTHSVAREQPLSDDNQAHVENITGWQADGITSVRFSLPLSALPDDGSDVPIVDDNMLYQWAMHDEDPYKSRRGDWTYADHKKAAGKALVNFVAEDQTGVLEPVDADNGGLWFGLRAAAVLVIAAAILVAVAALVALACGGGVLTTASAMRQRWRHRRRAPADGTPSSALPMSGAVLDDEASAESESAADEVGVDFASAEASKKPAALSRVKDAMRTQVPFLGISVAELLVFALWVLIHFIVLLAVPAPEWILSDAVGEAALVDAFLCVIFAARHSPIGALVGVAFEDTLCLHRWLGVLAVALSVLHVCLVAPRWGAGVSMVTLRNLWGLFALLGALLIFFSSLEWVRRHRFMVFYVLHFSFVVFFVFAAVHSPGVGLWLVVAAFAVFVVDKLIRLVIVADSLTSASVTALGATATKLVIPRTRLGTDIGVASYVMVQFPSLSSIDWHPFSLAGAPQGDHFVIYVKALGDATQRIVKLSQEQASVPVRVGGPDGGRKCTWHVKSDGLLLVSGGIGVTPILGALYCLTEALRGSEPRRLKHVCVSWSAREADLYREIAPQLQFIERTLRAHGVATLFQLKQERADVPELFAQCSAAVPTGKTTVLACGPRSLLVDAEKAARRFSSAQHRFKFVADEFEW
jgi:predicted ferric reductase